ncbi:hypothetical protein M1K46_01055 [Fictibacillus sp. WQ 8-8]|uniref:hypothetical protein n=1 Tax=Fictibacillus sp. WQ 8-8 TaxID=2938788 RepID=UPI00210A72D8|nr:hypothetical protein [Fictibacillus sp. WQ 8-8]MCQ6264257.1 hypothetical protein [Fictibacillus sp. WQ 8-8]
MLFLFLAVFVTFVAQGVVDFRFRMLAFRGAGGEPPRRRRLWVSPVPLPPQESRPLHSNQLVNEALLQKGSQSNNLLEKSLIFQPAYTELFPGAVWYDFLRA